MNWGSFATAINLKELSSKTGRTEIELAKAIITLLAMKAEITNIPQKVVCVFPKKRK